MVRYAAGVALLLARTHYSLLTAPTAPRALCEEAVRRGCDHLVLTDSNALYGLYPFAREAARARARPVSAAHPLLEQVFADTFGIMLYQEDVIRAAMTIASTGYANELYETVKGFGG